MPSSLVEGYGIVIWTKARMPPTPMPRVEHKPPPPSTPTPRLSLG